MLESHNISQAGRYVIYVRPFSPSKATRKISPEVQYEKLFRVVDKLHLNVVEEIEEVHLHEESVSGYRPGLSTLLRMLGKSEADGVLCLSLATLTREVEDLAKFMVLVQQGRLKSILTPSGELLSPRTKEFQFSRDWELESA